MQEANAIQSRPGRFELAYTFFLSEASFLLGAARGVGIFLSSQSSSSSAESFDAAYTQNRIQTEGCKHCNLDSECKK